MFGFIGFILIIILFIVLIVFALLGNIIRAIFGLGRRTTKQFYGNKTTSNDAESSYSSTQSAQTSAPSGNRKKIFTEDEGEYVEFEEVQ